MLDLPFIQKCQELEPSVGEPKWLRIGPSSVDACLWREHLRGWFGRMGFSRCVEWTFGECEQGPALVRMGLYHHGGKEPLINVSGNDENEALLAAVESVLKEKSKPAGPFRPTAEAPLG